MSTFTPTHSNFPSPQAHPPFDIWRPLRRWVDGIAIRDRRQAHLICRLIPCQCPFERTIHFLGRPLLHIPPLCKLNPLYEELIGLRLRALTYLADICEEDVTQYVC